MRRKRFLFLLVVTLPAAAVLFGCAGTPDGFECTDIALSAEDAFSADAIPGGTWLYQLQNADPNEIAETDYHILVIDYSRTGEESGRYSAAEMDAMKSRGSGASRTVLAYLSIGEAEDYRYYFDPSWVGGIGNRPSSGAPCWLGRTNPEWRGNYKVQYWSEDWQRIILGYLDKIIGDGFDGVYLDIVDAYEYWADEDNSEGFSIPKNEAAERMINFIKRIAFHARVEKGKEGFFIVPQNGEGIFSFDSGDYLKTINGIGIEDLYFWETEPIDPAITADRMGFIDRVKTAGKTVLAVDYVDTGEDSSANEERIAEFLSKARTAGYLPFAAAEDRKLDTIP